VVLKKKDRQGGKRDTNEENKKDKERERKDRRERYSI